MLAFRSNPRRRPHRSAAFFVTLAALLALAGAQAQTSGEPEIWPKVRSPYADDAAVEARVEEILEAMSLEQKVGQTIMAEIQSIGPADVKRFHIGGLLNGGGSFPGLDKKADHLAWLALAEAFYEASMDVEAGEVAVPVIWGTDAVHGHNNVIGATLFPHNVGLGAMHDPALMRDIGTVTAREVAATGIPWTFAPTVAVARDARWGRTYESYSEDPELVAEYGKEIIVGLQGHPALENALSPEKVVATAKHFVGDGGTVGGDDQGDVTLSEEALYALHGRPHAVALGAGVQTVMATFNSWKGEKTHGNPYLLTTILKERMGFDGFVVGDWNGHAQVKGCSNAACAQAFNAGVDMIMVPQDWRAFRQSMLRQVKNGDIPMARLDDAVRRILRVKLRAGLFDRGAPSAQILAGREGVIGHERHRAVAREAVRKSLVLLKNDGVLPLRGNARVLVTGPGAASLPMQAGGWSLTWQGNDTDNSDFPGATTLYAGIKEALSAMGGDAVLSENGDYDERPDAAVVIFGEAPYAEFEGDLTETVAFDDKKSLETLRRYRAAGIKTVAVFLTGRPRWAEPFMEAADAFVVAWLPGSEGGGLADVLIGDAKGAPRHDFAGRLSFSWPAAPDGPALPPGPGLPEGRNISFPRGYGLTYED